MPEQKKNETKRKFAGSRSEAKKWRFFLNEKNSLSLKQLFVLHGKISIFLHASPLNAGTDQVNTHINERSNVAKEHKGPASLFEREAEVLFGALKTKSCLSEASSFCLA
ncbi:MAG: hypothetical protein E7097_11310 [Bacteroides sp.]|nr:hypothetical protein [Bacteroides sp.]